MKKHIWVLEGGIFKENSTRSVNDLLWGRIAAVSAPTLAEALPKLKLRLGNDHPYVNRRSVVKLRVRREDEIEVNFSVETEHTKTTRLAVA